MTNQPLKSDPRLRAYIDASGSCRDRKFFYSMLEVEEPEIVCALFFKRIGVNEVWRSIIEEICGVKNS